MEKFVDKVLAISALFWVSMLNVFSLAIGFRLLYLWFIGGDWCGTSF